MRGCSSLVHDTLDRRKAHPSGVIANSSSLPFPQIEVKSVLVATDLSESSEKTLEHGIAIARHYGAILYLVYVVSSLGFTLAGPEAVELAAQASQRDIDTLVHRLSASGRLDGVDARPCILKGKFDDEIDRFAQAHRVDLIVVGSHGRMGLAKLVLGSVAETIAKRCSSPILTVGPQAQGPWLDNPDHREKPLMLATAFASGSDTPTRFAVALAHHFERPLFVLHLVPPRYTFLRNQHGLTHDVDGPWSKAQPTSLIPGGTSVKSAFTSVTETCDSAKGILAAADRIRAATIVIAEHRDAHPYLAFWHSRGVLDHVNREARCPVLTMRA